MCQDHGVLAVIFSVLAISFLLEIDDRLMGVRTRACVRARMSVGVGVYIYICTERKIEIEI